jgi:hypothetical protein
MNAPVAAAVLANAARRHGHTRVPPKVMCAQQVPGSKAVDEPTQAESSRRAAARTTAKAREHREAKA